MTTAMEPTGGELYEANHQHPANRALHAVGIPMIAGGGIAILLGPGVIGVPRRMALIGVAAGTALLFLGHALEGNQPAVFTRKRAVFDAIRWWARGALGVSRRALKPRAGASSRTDQP